MKSLAPTTYLISVATATPKTHFKQEELASMLGVSDQRSLRFFQHNHIHTRHLIFPDLQGKESNIRGETNLDLRKKFLDNFPSLIESALSEALMKANLKISDISYMACVTSTAFIVPSMSAHLIEALGIRRDCQRIDIVGMGCHAGINALTSVTSWCANNSEEIGLLICCELSSCIYCLDDSENSALVNSLFGDGVAVAILKNSNKQQSSSQPAVLAFSGLLIEDSLHCLRFDWDPQQNRNSFYVDKKTPKLLADKIELALFPLLNKFNLKISDINHWIVHSGGDAILNGIEKKLSLDENTFRHTRSVLRDFGNVSSGSFLFSYERLLEEGSIRPGDYGVMITMGPGLTIETTMIRWPS